MRGGISKMALVRNFACLGVAVGAVGICGAQGLPTQYKVPPATPEIAAHIQKVENGLVGPVVLKGDAATHSLADRMKQLNVPGVSIAVLHNGKIEWARGYGVASVGGPPVTPDTMFQAGSISKPVAAMAALKLVEQGKLSLDADINTELKSWKLPSDPVQGGKPVTLRELLTHTGGTTVHGFPGYASTVPVPTLVQVLNGEKPANTPAIRSEAAPMARWNYSGGGFTIMQQATIDGAGEPFPKLLHDTVLEPIGMTHSTYEQPLPSRFASYAATPYGGDGKPVAGGAHTYPELAAAGLWTTPTDILRYAMEVELSLEGKANHVLSADMTRQMVTPGMGNWGLGLEIGGETGNQYFSHGGVNEGFISLFVAYGKGGNGAAVMTNSDNGNALTDEVMRAVATAYGWPDWHPKVRAAVPADARMLAGYAGTYGLSPNFDLVLTMEGGQLMMQPTGQQKATLYPESDSKFFLTIVDAEVEIQKDGSGKVIGLILNQGGHEMKAARK
jgi:CubicO group peptidase (beta-lactamase class C family)